MTAAGRRIGRVEFTALLAMSMALVALGIDIMLPAFGDIRADLGLAPDSTAVTGLVTAYFLGLAIGQLAYGPLADRFGRKPTLYLGFGVYLLGALAAAFAPTLELLWVARFVWGLGAAAGRVVALAIVRDTYEGERMARAMSFIMAVFILVPVVAPTIGAGLTALAGWRVTFAVCAIAAALLTLWALRLPETLAADDRLSLAPRRVLGAARVVVSNRQTVGYTLAITSLYGVFTSWIASSELIIIDVFGQRRAFPFIFGGLACSMGVAMTLNARIVGRVGTRRLAHITLLAYLVLAGGLCTVAIVTAGRPPLWVFLVGMVAMLGAHALLMPNFNTVALQPMGAVAGTAAAFTGSVQIAVGALLGAALDRTFDGTILPLSVGFVGYGVLAMAFVLWAERGRLFQPLVAPLPTEATAQMTSSERPHV